jgi:hypothetical protein
MKRTPTAIGRELFQSRLKQDLSYRHWVLLTLVDNQTIDERTNKSTVWLNQIGFSTADACVLTALGEKLLGGHKLSPPDERTLLRRLPKYHAQFTESVLVEPPAVMPPRKPPAAETSTRGKKEKIA